MVRAHAAGMSETPASRPRRIARIGGLAVVAGSGAAIGALALHLQGDAFATAPSSAAAETIADGTTEQQSDDPGGPDGGKQTIIVYRDTVDADAEDLTDADEWDDAEDTLGPDSTRDTDDIEDLGDTDDTDAADDDVVVPRRSRLSPLLAPPGAPQPAQPPAATSTAS